MNSKYLYIFLLLTGLIYSCKEADGFEDKIYFSDAQASNTKVFSIYEAPQKFPITISSSSVVAKDTHVTIRVTEEQIDQYNRLHRTAYELLPAEYYQISSYSLTIEQGKASTQAAYLTVFELPMGSNYILPLEIAGTDGDLQVLKASSMLFLAFKPGIITPAANISNSYLRISQFAKEDKLKEVKALSYEARVKVKAWSQASHKISTLMGIEENFLLRFGDVNIEANQLQLAGGKYPLTSNTRFGLDTWYHIAVVYDGANITLYVNGKEDNSVKAPRGPINLTDTWAKGFHIGYSADGRYLNGTVSECRVWTKALTATEVNSNMCYVDPETPGLLAYWKFNEGAGVNIKDYGPYNYSANMSLSIPRWEAGVRCPEE